MLSHNELVIELLGPLRVKSDMAFLQEVRSIIQRVREVLAKYGCENAQMIVPAAKEAYGIICKAIDIPWVPELVETRLESIVWSTWLEPSLESIIASVCKK